MPLLTAPYSDGEVPAIDSAIDRHLTDAALPKAKLSNGNHYLSLGHQNGAPNHSAGDYAIPMHDQLAFTPRKIRVITLERAFPG